MFYIYIITNSLNGKVYIGQTNSPALRWSQHKYTARTEAFPVQLITRAIKKYGEGSFAFEVIAAAKTQDDCNELEQILITQYDALNLDVGYNLDPGGKNGPRSPETVSKITESLRRHYAEHDGWAKGRVMPEGHRKAIAEASVGKTGTNKGKKFSEETKAKMSASMVGKAHLKSRRFSPVEESEICKLYVEGLGTHVLGNNFNCAKSLIRDILLRNNIQLRKPYNVTKVG